MVSLPQLDDYSDKELKHFSILSPIYDQYRGVINKKTSDFSDQLRQEKHRYWLQCAFATLADSHTPEEICQYWSHHAENLLQKTWDHHLGSSQSVSLFAFGKLGSQELNLSSDIDIVFVKNSDIEEKNETSTLVKKFITSLAEIRPTGFAFRVDTNLRPGGTSSPLLPNQDNFFNFYDSYIEAWHRISFVRMRPIIGNKSFNDSIMNYCHRLSFPRRLDYSIIHEIKSIRSKLQTQWRKANEPLDVKFHPGGIRDIELYIQSLQVIYGGHKQPLQTSSISKALTLLCSEKIISKEQYDFLSAFYWKLRKVENHIHCLKDQHTYRLTPDIITSFAKKFDENLFAEELNNANKIVSEFFVDQNENESKKSFNIDNYSDSSQKAIKDISGLRSYSLKRSSVEKQRTELLDKYITHVESIAIDKELAIQTFRDFIFSIKSKSSVFYLLNRNEKLLENIAWLFSFSPYIGHLLCRRPELADSFALGKVDLNIYGEMDDLLESLMDYKLLGQIISISYLLKNHNISEFCHNLSHNADLVASTLLENLQKQFKSQKLDILCLGKWSGLELGIQSDLDFVFLCENDPAPNDIKVARRFINYMTSPSKAGKLYNIDLRLKPNEGAGPLLLKESDLNDFLKNKAQAWQKQAYLKSRLLSDNSYFYKSVKNSVHVSNQELLDLIDVHKKLVVKVDPQKVDLKYAEGGIVATEFRLQLEVLKRGLVAQDSQTLSFLKILGLDQKVEEEILQNYLFIRKFEQIYQICMESSNTKVPKGHPVLKRLGKVLKLSDPYEELLKTMKRQNSLLKTLDASN